MTHTRKARMGDVVVYKEIEYHRVPDEIFESRSDETPESDYTYFMAQCGEEQWLWIGLPLDADMLVKQSA